MKLSKSILVFVFVLLSTSLSAQKNIRPGFGYDQIHVGMQIEALKALIGEESKIISYDEEKANYEDSDYDYKTNLGFIIGFDQVYLFQNDNAYGVWKAYVLKNKIVYLNISSFTATVPIISEITIQDTLKFFDGVSQMETLFGKEYVKCIDPNGYTTYTYVNLGIRILFEGTKLRNVFIFKALKGKKATRLAALLPQVVS